MPQHWGDYALLAAWCTEDGNHFPSFLFYFLTESSRVNVDKHPSSGEKGCPLGLEDSLIYVAPCTAHSVLPSGGKFPVTWGEGEGKGLLIPPTSGQVEAFPEKPCSPSTALLD